MPDGWIDDHVGGEVNPRPDFAAELETTLAAAWHGRHVPSVRPTSERPRPRMPWRLAAGLGVAAALVVAIAVAVVVRGDSSSPADPTIAPSPSPVPTAPAASTTTLVGPATLVTTTGPATSTATGSPVETTPTSAAPTAAVLPDAGGFLPACVERHGSPMQLGGDPGRESFGPLQAQPALTITLPESIAPLDPPQPPGGSRRQSPMVRPIAIPGGVLLPIRASTYGSFPGTMLAAVNEDGTVRWVRCMEQNLIVRQFGAISGSRRQLLVGTGHFDGETTVTEWQLISLVDGSTGATAAERLTTSNLGIEDIADSSTLYAAGQGLALFGPAEDTTLDVNRDRLLLVELDSLAATPIPFPASLDGTRPEPWQFAFDDEDRPTWTAPGQTAPLVATFADGGWSAPPAPTVEVRFGPMGDDGPGMVQGVDPSGSVRWTNPDIRDIGGEGFRFAPSGDVTIVNACFEARDEYGFCPAQALAAIRPSDGAVLWRLDGFRSVAVVSDGYAIVSDPLDTEAGGWFMVDTASGAPVDGQRWDDPSAFEEECCGGYEFVHVERAGGIVIAVNERRVTVWYPAGYQTPAGPASVSLP